jgi:hypothetical protein
MESAVMAKSRVRASRRGSAGADGVRTDASAFAKGSGAAGSAFAKGSGAAESGVPGGFDERTARSTALIALPLGS